MPDNIEEVKDPGEEIITPDNADEKLGIETSDDEKETPAASSAEDKPTGEKTEEEADDSEEASEEESEESEEEAGDETDDGKPNDAASAELGEGSKKTPKPVPGETPREAALRREASRVKALLRKERGQKLLGDVQPQVSNAELSEEEKKALEAYDPEQLGNLEKAFTVLAKKHGYVKQGELAKQTYQETAQSILDDFLEKHEEYSAEKDPDGVLWNRFKEEYSLYNKPANPKDFTRIFNKIHNEIFGITTTPKQTPGQVKAKQEKIKVASHGAGSSVPSRISDKRKTNPTTPELSKVARSGGLVGFTEEQLAEMGL